MRLPIPPPRHTDPLLIDTELICQGRTPVLHGLCLSKSCAFDIDAGMQKGNEDLQLILASQSPRRRHLLEQAGLSFSVIPSRFDEKSVGETSPVAYVRTAGEGKARDVSIRYPLSWVIGADTIVLINGDVLGKPGSEQDARSMLQRLSGKTHKVLTGYAIFCRANNITHSAVVSTQVFFKHLTDAEIEWYIHTQEPYDKAGAYAIQGLGTFLVKGINGSYTNVVGLPVCEVIEFLRQRGGFQT